MDLATTYRNFVRILFFAGVFSVTLLAYVASSFAATEGGDATKNVHKMETQRQWFYWPGWAFAALTLVVIGLVFFGWYKSVLGPKYRGKKLSQ